jgi:hypothetical protein
MRCAEQLRQAGVRNNAYSCMECRPELLRHIAGRRSKVCIGAITIEISHILIDAKAASKRVFAAEVAL